MTGPAHRLIDNAVEVATSLVTAFWLAALLTGQDWWLGALIVGYVAVVPIVKILVGEHESQEEKESERDERTERGEAGDTESTDEALATLRERYARGELTEEQFERKLERLLEVETVEDASEYADRRPRGRTAGERPAGGDHEREPEYE